MIGIEAIELYNVRERGASYPMIARIKMIPQPGMLLWDRYHKQPASGQFVCTIKLAEDQSVESITQACSPGGRRYHYHADYDAALNHARKWINRRFSYRQKTEA